MAGSLAACGAMAYGGLRGARFNRFVSDTYSPVVGAVPSGYSGLSYVFPIKAGGLTGASTFALGSDGYAVGGITADGSSTISVIAADAQAFPLDDAPPARTASASFSFFTEATGGLISTANGSASLTFTVADALLVASLGGAGSAALSITTNTPILGAIADADGSATFTITCTPAQARPLNDASPLRDGTANFAITGSLTPYAIGQMQGSTVDTTVLTVDTITAALIAAAMATPLHANVKQVNDVVVTGDGQPGTEWGP